MAENKNIARFYNRLSFFYPVADRFLHSNKKVLLEVVNDYPSARLLEVGAGDGNYLTYYHHNVTAIDISSAMLEKAKLANPDKKLLVMDATEMTFEDSSFEYVVASHVLSVSASPGKIIEEAYRVLSPGGKLFILNHFTPSNAMKYFDRIFQPFSSLLYFNSHFSWKNIEALKAFRLDSEISTGRSGYFKLLIFSRP